MLTEKQKRINQIGNTIFFLGRLAIWGASVWTGYNGHWVIALYLFVLGLGFTWKNDGKWADDGEKEESK